MIKMESEQLNAISIAAREKPKNIMFLQKCSLYPNHRLKKDGTCSRVGCREGESIVTCGGVEILEPNIEAIKPSLQVIGHPTFCPLCFAPNLLYQPSEEVPPEYKAGCLECRALFTEEDMLMLAMSSQDWSQVVRKSFPKKKENVQNVKA